MSWLTKLFGSPPNHALQPKADDPIAVDKELEAKAGVAASVDGRHYTEHVEGVKVLIRQGRLDEAIQLLLRLIDATEAESEVNGFGVAPWYYEQLAIVYRQQSQSLGERAILERYAACRKALGAGPKRLAQRLKQLDDKNS